MKKKIFLSVGRTSTYEQEDFVREVEKYIENQGLIPQTLGRTYWSSLQPLRAVGELMRECCGTVVIALERIHIKSGIQRRGSLNQQPLQSINLTTVWNQIEAAMAYTLGHPLLVIVEKSVKDEGLLEQGYDWYVNSIDLNVAALHQREFVGVFADWKRRVDEFEVYLKVDSNSRPVSPPQSRIDANTPLATPATTGKIRILFLTANPSDSNRLSLDRESRAIDQALRRAEFRDLFEVSQFQAVQISDLQDCLLRFKPHIVHFSGHGTSDGELILEDITGNSQPVSERALSTLFSVLKDNVRCVLLNACYSKRQADAIAQHIDCVVGMSGAIGDVAAISFSASFYQAIAYGRDIKTAFDLGCIQIDLASLDEQDVPVLIAPSTEPSNIHFCI